MTELEKMLSGRLYLASYPELTRLRQHARQLTELYNAAGETDSPHRAELLGQLFGSVGENPQIRPSFHCDYGCNIQIGNYFYANYDCIILDVAPVTIGDNVLFAPRVCIFTAAHPIDADVRNRGLEYGKPVTIGSNVWIGGNVTINPGVTIGSGVVIGSGSVVTKDIPDHVVAAGNPCRVLRPITAQDANFWRNLEQSGVEVP